MYICVGGLSNTINQIIDPISNNVLAESRDVVLSCSEGKWMWISWVNGVISVGKDLFWLSNFK